MNDARILIIGGGIGGLTAALALQQKGLAVAVYEAVPQLAEVGAGVTITPNCCHVLNHLLGEAEVATQAMPNIVSVEVHHLSACLKKGVFKRSGDCGFANTANPGKHDSSRFSANSDSVAKRKGYSFLANQIFKFSGTILTSDWQIGQFQAPNKKTERTVIAR